LVESTPARPDSPSRPPPPPQCPALNGRWPIAGQTYVQTRDRTPKPGSRESQRPEPVTPGFGRVPRFGAGPIGVFYY